MISISLTFNGTPITAGQLLQSEFLRALALDQHVNRPDHVVKALQACTNVLHNPDYLVSNDSNHPPTWVSDCYMIRMILEAKRIYDQGNSYRSNSSRSTGKAEYYQPRTNEFESDMHNHYLHNCNRSGYW